MRRITRILAAAAVVSGVATSTAQAERFVFLNGQRLTNPQIMQLERLNCVGVPNGRYQVQGNYYRDEAGGPWLPVGYCCYAQCRHPSLSERGQLFRPGELFLRD
jgi:hypothetical protein